MDNIFDSDAENYSNDINKVIGRYGAKHDFFMQHKANLIKKIAQSRGWQTENFRLLDVGCGTGMLHPYIVDLFSEIQGLEISEPSLEIARKKNPGINYTHYDGKVIPFEDSEFDFILAVGMFHHVPPNMWNQVASEICRVTKQKGAVLVIEHNPYNPITRRIVNTCDLDKDAVLLRPRKLKSIFKACGLNRAITRTCLSVPPTNPFLFNLDFGLGVLPFGAQYYFLGEFSN